MTSPPLILSQPPELTDENATEILQFLYDLAGAFEERYASQLRRYQQQAQSSQGDLFEDQSFDDFDDELPLF